VVVARLAIGVQLPNNETVTVAERREQRSFWTVADFAVFCMGPTETVPAPC
jgi:hypothetical protein